MTAGQADRTPPRARRRPDLGIADALVQASFLVQAVLGELAAEQELSIVQMRLLGVLRDRELRMAQLARILGLTKSSTSGLVDRAERRGLVRRTAIPVGDERAVHVVLSEEGRRLTAQLGAQVARRLEGATEHLSPTNRGRLSGLLTDVVLHDAERHGIDLSAGQSSSAQRSVV
ncbi:MAG TPA: MarR family transcriptional regulator [Solirubrobacteraceae bacterium]|jgi:DNA-binding MarR family transcriptional regulator|nr:MarR family transcriptional regulator [Solirubrobacteraceae bacterium]